jgi:hypothetical protein
MKAFKKEEDFIYIINSFSPICLWHSILLQNRFFLGTPHRQYKTLKFLHTKLLIFILLKNTHPLPSHLLPHLIIDSLPYQTFVLWKCKALKM